MTLIKQVTDHIISQLPKEVLLTEDDIEVLKQHEWFFTQNADALIKDFYDVLFSNPETANLFHEGERPIREESFRNWINKTITGDFDESYWQWQTYVGILHIKRKITNNVMITMMGRVTDIVTTATFHQLPVDDALALKTAWIKLAAMVLSLISESYHYFYITAISEVTGMTKGLLRNAVRVEIDNFVEKFKYIAES